jgi:hypothetical protein
MSKSPLNMIKRFTYISKSDTCKTFALKCSLLVKYLKKLYLKTFLTIYIKIYKFQLGFIPGLSTTHQLLEIYHTNFYEY